MFSKTSRKKFNAQPIDVKAMQDADVRKLFGEVLPDYDDERVYTNDMRKVFNWYNQLIAAGITEFKNDEIAEDEAAEQAEKLDAEQTAE